VKLSRSQVLSEVQLSNTFWLWLLAVTAVRQSLLYALTSGHQAKIAVVDVHGI